MLKPFTDAEMIAWEQNLPSKIMNACLAIRHQDTVLMVKASYKDHWTFPSGVIDEHEPPLTAAIRETFEETGVVIDPAVCRPLGIVYTSAKNGHRDRIGFAFVTELSTPDLTFAVPNDEIEAVQWVPIAEIAAWSHQRATYQTYQALLSGESVPFYSEH
jgi:8-oxo-dGTP diphosphatase